MRLFQKKGSSLGRNSVDACLQMSSERAPVRMRPQKGGGNRSRTRGRHIAGRIRLRRTLSSVTTQVFLPSEKTMLLLLLVLSVSWDLCHSQYVYGGVVPRYNARRPVRRSAIEALERLRLPVAHYFPQVDTQVASAPWPPSDMYALPPQWSDDLIQAEEDPADYTNYEYDALYRPPVYAEEVYPQEVEPEGPPYYNDLVSSYLMEVPEVFENVQRRNEGPGPVALNKVFAANDRESVSTTSVAPPAPTPQQPPQQQVQMTAVPASPEKKNVKSLVVPDAPPSKRRAMLGGTTWGRKRSPCSAPSKAARRPSGAKWTTWPGPRIR
ncbi:hypothetical protein CDAR_485771 [Caerostris darwini]|uniref:Uncharacterized protein n=1 Tax=Caerostris darwini TaxID=1538125 RepID=A0AAV4WML1_9ARAC|nr:hypothetical protein CDAR_485771 [Caerostris darwini]